MTEWFEQWFGEEYHALYPHRGRTLERSERAPKRSGNGERRSEVRVTRKIGTDGRFVIKEIELRDAGRSFQERVRLSGADDLASPRTDAGLRITARFGDYDGVPVGPDTPRVIVVGARA